MRVGAKRKTDFEAISRRSIKRDFFSERIYIQGKKMPENEKTQKITITSPDEGETKRISTINQACMYAKYARFFVGKLVRLVSKKGVGDSTTYYEFVHDEDRKALNQAAGWSDNKKQYLLYRPKFK